MKKALQYHDLISYDRYAMKGGSMDWSNQPSVFKEYPDLTPLALPSDVAIPQASLFDVMDGKGPAEPSPGPMTLHDLAAVMSLAYGFTARSSLGAGNYFYYRSAPSAGALYPVEFYLSAENVPSLDDGLYHYAISRFGLYPLRKGSFDEAIRSNLLSGRAQQKAALTFFLSAVFYRSSWKYRDRAYRYHLLDTGHALENLLLALTLVGRPPRIFPDFDDPAAAAFLGLNPEQEGVLALVRCSEAEEATEPSSGALNPISHTTSPVAPREESFAPIRDIHAFSFLCGEHERDFEEKESFLGGRVEQWIDLAPVETIEGELNMVQAVSHRRSKRNFITRPLDATLFARIVKSLDLPKTGNPVTGLDNVFSVGVVTGAVDGIEPGFYEVDPYGLRLGSIKSGKLCGPMAQACLDQMWLANASAQFVFLADFEELEKRFGPRGYRYAMMEAGRLGQRLYLAASALNIGCCGIGAFYDNEAANHLDLENDQRMLYLVGIGVVKK